MVICTKKAAKFDGKGIKLIDSVTMNHEFKSYEQEERNTNPGFTLKNQTKN
jgi:hypothetical protein